ncbi:molecular chaperone, partial [Klebsiella pneumoniae]|nr:molecular chaperone [Klebsiella pneumoniae]
AAIAMVKNAPPPQEQLTLRKENDKYVVINPTAYYITLVDAATKKDGLGIKNFEPVMVPPKSSLPLRVSVAEMGNSPVLTYVNDYG